MTRSKLLVKKTVLSVALIAATAGVASADYHGGDMGRFSDSYQYFASQPIDEAPSAWRAANPQGMPERFFQSSSAWGVAWKDTPVFSSVAADAAFKQNYPNGLTESEFQALSSDGSAWHAGPRGGALATSDETAVAQGAGNNTLAERVQQFFHQAKSDVQAQ